jgi:hypothetical protein
MPDVEPTPITIALPEIPPEFSPDEIGRWTRIEPVTWTHPEIPNEIEFPILPDRILLPLKIKCGKHTFEVALALTVRQTATA